MSVLRAFGDGTFGAGTFGGSTPSSVPQWVVAIPDEETGWADIACDARSVEVHAGRTSYVEAFDAATATVVLYNPDGRYSTWTPNSVWARDGFVTGVPIRVGVALDGLIGWRFAGTTDSVADAWPAFTDVTATVTATDAFKGLARVESPAGAVAGAGELPGARIARFLDAAAYTGPRRLDAGLVPLQGTDGAGVALENMRRVGEAEWGWLYVDHDGAVTFRQRDAGTTDPRMSTVQFTFTDSHAVGGAHACYGEATVLAADESTIVNVAQVTPPGLALSTYVDTASRAHFGPRTWSRTDLPIRDQVDAATLAQLVVATYSADDQRIDAVTIDAANHANAWPAAMGCEITDRIRFIRTVPGGYQVDAELLVQGRIDRLEPSGVEGVPAVWSVEFSTASASVAGTGCKWDSGRWDKCEWGA